MKIEAMPFGKIGNGAETVVYIITNSSGASVSLLNYGATVTEINVPNTNGDLIDVILGYDSAIEYDELANSYFFGATIGRVGNRIENAQFVLNGKEYRVNVNHENKNCLHGGSSGFHTKIWDAEIKNDSVVFSRVSSDGEEGFPGNLQVSVIYSFTDDNELVIDYIAKSDSDTIINMTNHSYFNLGGHNSGSINNHWLQIAADKFAESDGHCLATGNFIDVAGTSFDFTEPRKFENAFDDSCEQQQLVGGFDHSFVISGYNGMVRKAANIFSPDSGIKMNVYTNKPAIHLYTGNFMEDMPGKGGSRYGYRGAFCLETQYLPNAMQHNNFPSIVLHKGDTYMFRTVYAFSTI